MKHFRRHSTRATLGAPCGFRRITALAAILGLAAAAAAQEHVVINFDKSGLAAGVHSGNLFLADGVRITTCAAPDKISVGGNITLTDLQPWFELWRYGWAVSPPNYVVALDAGVRDILLSFTVPVTSVEMDLDFYPNEGVDTDRLVVIEAVESRTFKVLKSVTFTDDKAEPPAKRVSIDLGGGSFSYVLFQTLTELEGFDNLTFDTTGPIPDATDDDQLGPKPDGSGDYDNENKAPESPTTDNLNALNVNSGGTAEVNLNSDTDTQQPETAGGGACGVPVAIIMLCCMLLLRLLSHGGPTHGKPQR